MARERAWKQPAKGAVEDEEATRAALSKIEDEWMAARLRGDPGSSRKLLDDAYVGADSQGFAQNKAQFIASIERANGSFTEHSHSVRTISFRGDVATSTGIATIKSAAHSHAFRYLRVYLRKSGEWNLIASQSTPLG